MLEADFVVSSVAKWLVAGVAATAKGKLFFVAGDDVSLRIHKLEFSFDAKGAVFQHFDYNVRHWVLSSEKYRNDNEMGRI